MSRALEEWLDEAEAALETGEPQRALECAEEALALDATNRDGLCLKATALVELDRLEEADPLLDSLVARFPKDAKIMLTAASAMIRYDIDNRDRVEAGLDLLDGLDRAKDEDVRFEALLLMGIGLVHLGEFEPALKALAAALDVDPDDLDARLHHCMALFEAGRFDEAKHELTELTRDEPDDAEAWHYLGLIGERTKDADAARRFFEKAQRLDSVKYPVPVKLSDTEFDAVVADAITRLPEAAQAELGNVTISVEPVPDDDEVREGTSPLVLGVCIGASVDERDPTDDVDHQTVMIKLFQRNLERFARSRDELIQEIGVTLLHEVGHLMGLDEDDLAERGLD